jgi:transaldolase
MEVSMNNSQKAYQLGQSIWYDNIQRRLLENGEMASMIERGEIYGVTSNPSIFNSAIAKSDDYDDDLIPLIKAGKTAEEIFETLAIEDIRNTADLFEDVYSSSSGRDGYVSLEVNPKLANETEVTCKEAQRLWDLVDRPNLMIKIPATKEGLPAITHSIANGLNVNVTLIFSQERYDEVMDAYLAGLEARIAAGKPIDRIASVASFFVSRIDTKVDNYLNDIISSGVKNSELAKKHQGKVAIANAKVAYQRFKSVFKSERFSALKEKGAHFQRPLWASTSTKNPAYPDVLYVENLIGQDTVNTIPPKTLQVFNHHGKVNRTIENGLSESQEVLENLQAVGISLAQVTQELEIEGVASFSAAFNDLLSSVEARRLEING